MKQVFSIVLSLFLVHVSHAQVLRNIEPTASVQKVSYLATADASNDCKKYKTMKAAGIGLSIGGGVFFITGIALVAAGDANVDNGMRGAGGGLLAVGVLSLGAGIPLAVIGSHRLKKYCTSATLELHSGSHGSGLALNF